MPTRVALVVVLAVAAVACSSDGTERSIGSPVGQVTEAAGFSVQAGIGFLAITEATPGSTLTLFDPQGAEVGRDLVDRFGSLVFRDLAPGSGYTIRQPLDDGVAGSTGMKVLALDEHPPTSFYEEQEPLVDGYQYLTTRDGTTLSITVRLPGPITDGPYPTLINMSGYADSDPDSAPPMSQIAGALGYATVSVNVRGTGCSGGLAGLFDEIWAADGYDVVETVAAQEWAGKVGLTGISFPGITQLFAAATRPPHLAAATPMSVIADTYRSPGYPGGIFNDGFTESWLTDRRNDAKPVPEGGQGYAVKRVEEGDEECARNQILRLQTLDPIEITSSTPFLVPKFIENRSARNWVSEIEVPTLLMGSWQDEQVGSDFAHLIPLLPRRDDIKFVGGNGVHSGPIEPDTLTQWLAFVDIYVAERVPDPAVLESIYPVIAPQAQGGDEDVPDFPENPYEGVTTVAEAKAIYEALPRVRILFDNGGDAARPGVPGSGFEQGFDSWPPTEAAVTRWFFGADGTLNDDEPAGGDGFDRYFPTIDARPMQTIPGQGQSESWVLLPAYDWRPLVPDTAVAYATAPLESDMAMVGTGSVDLWVRSSEPDTDLQVALTEVRPDGTEIYVQNGFLRASHRKLDPDRSSVLVPWPTHLEADAQPMPADEFVSLRIEVMPVAHVFREGSRLRISVAAPGGDRTRWSFRSEAPRPNAQVEIARSADHPSSIALPLIDIDAPTPPPACPGLRGQPCREYEPATNGG